MKFNFFHVTAFYACLNLTSVSALPHEAVRTNIVTNIFMMVRNVPWVGEINSDGTHTGFCGNEFLPGLKEKLKEYGYNLNTRPYYLVNVDKGDGNPRLLAPNTEIESAKRTPNSSGMAADLICSTTSEGIDEVDINGHKWFENILPSNDYYTLKLRGITPPETAEMLEIARKNNRLKEALCDVRLLAIDNKTTAIQLENFKLKNPCANIEIIKHGVGEDSKTDLKQKALKRLVSSPTPTMLITDSILAINIWEGGNKTDKVNGKSLKDRGFTVYPNQAEQRLEGFEDENYVIILSNSNLGNAILLIVNEYITEKREGFQRYLDGVEAQGLIRVREDICQINNKKIIHLNSSCEEERPIVRFFELIISIVIKPIDHDPEIDPDTSEKCHFVVKIACFMNEKIFPPIIKSSENIRQLAENLRGIFF